MSIRGFAASLIGLFLASAGLATAQTAATVGPNVVANGGFEEVGDDGLPVGWSSIEAPTGVTDEAHSGRRALRMVAEGKDSVIVNGFETGAPAFGVMAFWYKIVSSDSNGENIRVYAIPWKDGEAEPRAVWVAPRQHVGDGKWHRGTLQYGFRTRPPAVIIAPRINEGGLAGKGEALFDDIELRRLGPGLEVGEISASRPAIIASEDFTLKCAVRNVGGEELKDVRIEARAEGNLSLRPVGRNEIANMPPGDEAAVTFSARSEQARIVRVTVTASSAAVRAVREMTLPISRPFPPGPRARKTAGAGVGESSAWIGDDSVWLDLVRNPDWFGPGILYGRVNGRWRRAGVLAPLATVVTRDDEGMQEHHVLLLPAETEGEHAPQLALSGEATTRDGATLAVRVTYRLEPNTGRLRVRCSLQADREVKVLAFRGPWLYAGERSFGAKKDSALFGGLEYLNASEPSSNYLYSAPPLDDRRVPHPYKVTIPVMAVERGGLVTGLTWNPLQEWARDEAYPSAYFAAPNRFAEQDNHAMGLFAPRVPTWVQENHLTARTPYALKRGETMTLEATIFASEGASALDAMDHWFAAHPVPDHPKMPRTFEEELKVIGLPSPRPNIEAMVRDSSIGIAARLALQRADGSWGYETPDKARGLFKDYAEILAAREKTLGIPGAFSPEAYARQGDSASGLQGWNLMPMLTYARITGNEVVLDASLKGLKFLDSCDRPEGAQTWEVPLHAPDILASAQAVEAFLSAYRITGDKQYLESAKRWARTGLPFTYFWNAHDRPVMLYGTIPIYGTSIFVVSWYGNLVQWCGMWYARALIRLSQADDSFPWRKVGEGITACCVQQHMLEGKYKNAYPDGWNMVTNRYGGTPIHPGDIFRNIHLLKGTFAEPDFRVLRRGKVRVHINAESPIAEASLKRDALTIKLRPGPKSLARVTISGVAEFASATANGTELDRASGQHPGWRRLPLYDDLLMLSVPGDREVKLVLQGLKLASVTRPLTVAAPSWTFDRPGDSEGWLAANDLAPLVTRDGRLVCKATGPDPQAIGPAIELDAAKLHVLHTRILANKDATIQVYWSRMLNSQVMGFNAKDVLEFQVRGDSQLHDYKLDLAQNDGWRGHIVALRLDPGTTDCEVEFDSVSLAGE